MKLKLAKVGNSQHRSVIRPTHDGVVLRSTGDVTYTCPHCERTLAEKLAPNQVWDVVIECYGCKLASQFPRLPPGSTATGYMALTEAVWELGVTFDLPAGLIVIGVGNVTPGGM